MKKTISLITSLFIALCCIPSQTLAETSYEYSYILPTEYTDLNINREHKVITACDKNGKYAVYDYNGKKLSNDYDLITPFTDDTVLTRATKGDTSYIIDKSGKELSSYTDRLWELSDTFAFVDISGNNDGRPIGYSEGEFAVFNAYTGKQLTTFPYEKFIVKNQFYGFDVYNEKMIFHENGKYGILDLNINYNSETDNTTSEPQIITEATYDNLSAFGKNGLSIAKSGDKYGIIDVFGEMRVSLDYDLIKNFEYPNESYYIISKNGLFGICDDFGNILCNTILTYEPQRIFPEYQLIEVSKPNTEREDKDEYNTLYGLIDYDGNIVLPIEHTSITTISEGRIAAQKTYDQRGFYNIHGQEITDFKYRMITPYSKGIAFTARPVDEKNFIWEYEAIDIYGNIIFKPDTFVYTMNDGVAYTDKKTFINKSGKNVIDFSNKENFTVSNTNWHEIYKDGIYKVTENNCSGVIKLIKPIVEPLWDYKYIDFGNVDTFTEVENGYIFTLLDNNTVYIDSFGNVTENADDIYSSTAVPEENTEKIYTTYSNGIYTVTNSDGKILASCCNYVTEIGDNGYIGISSEYFNGYINSNGDYVLTLTDGYKPAGPFSEGVAPVVKNVVYGLYGETSYINEQGDIVLTSQDKNWVSGSSFKNGLFTVGVKLGKAGPTGKMLVKCLYDTPSDWAESDIEKAIDEGILTAELQKRYKKNITRETFCEIAYNLPIIKNQISDTKISGITFTDTDNEKISALAGLGIIKGVGDNKFAPDSFITREEAATILDRIYNNIPSSTTPAFIPYSDDSSISDWAKSSVYNMKNAEIMIGVGDNKFAPKDNYTTEQSVVTIMRINSITK